MYICICNAVTERDIGSAVAGGCGSLRQLRELLREAMHRVRVVVSASAAARLLDVKPREIALAPCLPPAANERAVRLLRQLERASHFGIVPIRRLEERAASRVLDDVVQKAPRAAAPAACSACTSACGSPAFWCHPSPTVRPAGSTSTQPTAGLGAVEYSPRRASCSARAM